MRNLFSPLICIASLIVINGTLSAAEIDHGHHAMQIFDKQGYDNSPLWVRIWIACMMMSFLAGLFFVKKHVIARWVVGGLLAVMIFTTVLGSALGIPNYSGFVALAHLICWTPALYILLTKRPFLEQRSAFSIWSGVVTAVIVCSFIFDIQDAYIFLTHML